MSTQIQDEDDLQAHIMKKFAIGRFAKVSQISTIPISPDIDLLRIDENIRLVTGFEFKLLRYRKVWKRVNIYPMYQGIGQALAYLNFGVDRSYLVLGLRRGVPKKALSQAMYKIEETAEVFNKLKAQIGQRNEGLRQIIENLTKRIDELAPRPYRYVAGEGEGPPCGFNCLGIKVWTEHNNMLTTILKAEEKFPVYADENLKHKKQCLLRKEFKYNKNFPLT